MADNLTAKYADLDTNSIGPIRFVDIGGVFYAVSILAQSDGTLLDTLPVSAASLPLPSGASTAAKQPALGTAGTASADVITVQGIASMTALKVDGSAVTQPVSGTFWQATQPVSVASVPSHDVTNAGTFAVQAAQSGTWNVTNVSGTVSLPTGASTLAEQQSQTTALQLIDDSVVAVDAVGTSAKVLMQGAIRDDALSALTPVEGDAVNLRTDANGALWVIPSGTTTISGTVDLGATDNAVLDAIAASVAAIEAGQLADSHNVTIDNASIAVTGTFWQATQPVSGTVTANATLQAGTAYAGKVRLTDGTTDAEVVPLTGYNAQAVAIVDGSGDQITSFGGGTEYTEDAAAAANPVGKATILVRADTPGAVATTDGDNVAQRGTNYGAAYVQVVDSSGNFIDSFGGAGGTSSADDADFTAGTTLGTIVQGVYESTPTSVTDGDVGALGITNDRRLKTSAVVTSMPTTTVQATNLDIRDLTNADVVTAELSATDNAVLDAIAASVAGTLTVGSHAVTNAGTFAVQAAQSGTWNVTNVSGTVSLPTGASTLAEQQSQTTLLGTIDADTGSIATAAASIDSKTPALGQALAAASVPVVLTAAQLSTLTPPAAITGFATESTLSTLNTKFTTGTVIGDVNLGATDNAVLDAIAASVAAIDAGQLADGHNVTIDNASIAVTGTFWQATQPISGTVDLGATDNAVLDTIASPVATIGTTPLQRVAIFDASNTQITSFGGGTEYTEDAVAAADPVGKATILVREDAPVSVAADGDNVAQRGTAYGAAYVQVVDSSGNFIDTFGGSGGTSTADDADFTAGTTLGTIVQGVYESTPTTVTDGDVGALGITNDRRLKTSAVVTSMPTTTVQATDLDIRALVNTDVVTAELSATDNAVLDAIAASVAGTITVDNAGTFAVQVDGSALTALQKIDDTVIVDDAAFTPATSSVNVAGFVFDDTTPDSVDEGDAGAARMSANRCQYMQIRDGFSGQNERGAAVSADGELYTIDTTQYGDNEAVSRFGVIGGRMSAGGSRAVEITNTRELKVCVAAGATNFAKAEDEASASADVGVPAMAIQKATPANTAGTDGDYEMLQMSAGRLWTSATIDTALPAGTNAIGKLASNTGVTIGAVEIAAAQTLATVTTVSTVTTCSTVTTLTGGGVAHDGVDSGNPIKIGARAAATLSDDTMVANADRADAVSDLDGALIVRNQFPLADLLSERVSNTDGASTAFTTFGATASARSYVTALSIYNASASAGYVDFRDGTAGSVLYTVPIPAGAGVVLSGGGLPLFRTTANTALAFDVSAALTTVYISISGFKSKASG